MKTILVTGGAGHVGSHIIEQLISTDPNNNVISLDNYFTGKVENHIVGAEYRVGHTKDIFKHIKETPDIIFHLGEYARIAPSFQDIEKVYDMNILGTFQVVEFCRQKKVSKLVYAASSTKFAIEGNGRNQNPYSFSKATNVDLINNYGAWFGLPYAICYFYNAFGPRENSDPNYGTLIAKYERAWLNGEKLKVVKPGTQKRNFTYVGDLARGIIQVAQKGNGDGYALGNTNSYSVLEIAESFGNNIEFIDGYPGRAESGEAPNKAREEFGWEATVNILEYIDDFCSQNKKVRPSKKVLS
ncbi:hypothetical protein A2572_03215 [Candidatus Collierbacteria bacterium RIFOXYD1_FULL_40_9]|uniref:NAD-dependent epimerase/dehydratase domain-containing protein n=1 Tax=Candidatus Collierbacteria bacterium RIFOXYD1_FULL_40_9 TaxID=1817731 RepID=A0A1F5FWW0_9BACT|nr:MAG: hypothetical protein A2572_03215 [Candidatus Collierbacteria bacterium RIFOXYD1_FULL_40_9]